MKGENKAFKIEKHVHNYPHCWRTDKPVLYYPLDSWLIFLAISKPDNSVSFLIFFNFFDSDIKYDDINFFDKLLFISVIQ